MSLDKNYMGSDTFQWFVGVVESRQDPLALGRVKVRVYGWHTASLADIPSDDLPWATVAQAPNTDSSPWLKEGDTVLGFFADSRSAQIPIIISKLPGYAVVASNQGEGFNDLRTPAELKIAPRKPTSLTYNTDGSGINIANPTQASTYPLPEDLDKPTLPGASRYDIANTVIKSRQTNLDKGVVTATGLQWDEPYPAYNALYPYNKATATESGHVIEVDDTPGNERIAFTHRSGSFSEFYPSGSKVQKVTKSNYTIVMGDDYVHIMGRALLSVGAGSYIKVLGDVNIEAGNDLNLEVSGNMNLSVKEALNIKAASLNIDVSGKTEMTSGEDTLMTSGAKIELVASSTFDALASDINLQIAADSATVAGISTPDARGEANEGQAGPEPTPVPFTQNFASLDNYTGQAYKQAQMLNEDGTTPDSTASNTASEPASCGFDPNVKTFLSSDQWAMSTTGLNALKQREGLSKVLRNGLIQAYLDVPPNCYAIGYGCGASVLPASFSLNANTTITKAQAEQFLLDAINDVFLPKLREYINVDLTQGQVDAMISFMYNVGFGQRGFAGSSVRRFANQRDWCNAADSLLLWNKSGGKVVQGIIKRRQSERQQFLS